MTYAKTLSREEMKNIKAGGQMCCWDGGGACSECVDSDPRNSCVEGAHLHTCNADQLE